jgi:phenylalanyl-tRNA synthetase beta chain
VKLPLSWLREYVDVDLPLEELARRINDSTAEVEGWEIVGADWDREKVVVAEVLAVEPHPNADTLRLATVNAGSGQQTVVCGAPNVAAGQKVAFAFEGAQLVSGKSGKVETLKRAKIRGVESAGMVLSEMELGLSDDHTGILELPPEATVGRPLAEELGDVVLDLSTWANRADLLGVLGLAREVAALTGGVVRDPATAHSESETPIDSRIKVTVEDPDLCPRFTASLIEDVTIGPSPAWLQERLIRMGMRPINNVVDITNYVMLEMGQPLHAFDYDLVRGKQIVVRRAKQGERMTTLDDVDREFDSEMLLICDGDGPVGIAGIMGGLESEVTENTKNVLLEIANFNPGSIRRTSTLLKLRSEASLRFEKGIGRETPIFAQHRALHLFEQISGGRVARGIVDVFAGKEPPRTIILPAERIERVLGITIPPDDVRRVLTDLGFLCHHLPPDRYSVQPPYWRPDVEIPDDVIEDLIRIYGYDRLPDTTPRGSLPPVEFNPVYDLREALRDAAVAAGLQEVINYTLTDRAHLEKVVDPADQLRRSPLNVVNPVASQHAYLRTSLRGSVLSSFAANQRQQDGALRLFEIGFEYLPTEADLPHERPVLCAAVGGHRESRWLHSEGEPLDFFDAKGLLESILDAAGIAIDVRPAAHYGLLEGHTAEVLCGKDVVGLLAQVHPETAASFDIDDPVFVFELRIEDLARHVHEGRDYQPVERFPVVRVDLSLLVSIDTPAGDVLRLVRSHRAKNVRVEADLFDDYRGAGVPEGQKALAVSIRYCPSDRTLADDDVSRIQDGLLKRLDRELGARLRK